MASCSPLYPRPLDSNKPEIRLLELLPGDDAGQIKCRLSDGISLDDTPPFAALSYVWGDASDTTPIEVNGLRVPVTKNLAAALHSVFSCWQAIFPSRELSSFRIWIDALCINQSDLAERSHQVKLMPRLYSTAEVVLAWLGTAAAAAAEEEEDTDATLRLGLFLLRSLNRAFYRHGLLQTWDREAVCRLAWLHDVPLLLREDTHARCWDALRHLFGLSYWRRAWIFQENVLASRLWYFYPGSSGGGGGGRLTFDELVVPCMILSGLTRDLTERNVPRPEFVPGTVWMFLAPMDKARWLDLVPVLRIKIAKDVGRLHARDDEERRVDAWGYEPELLLLGGTLRASDPKDHVYALLALTSITVDVDYSSRTTVRDVLLEYCQGIHAMTDRLGERRPVSFLQYGGIGVFENRYDLPSWAPNFPEASAALHHRTMGCNHRQLTERFQSAVPPPRISGAMLSVSGVRLQTVKKMLGTFPPCGNLLEGEGEVHAWLQDYVNRYPVYPGSFPPLWALFLVVMRMTALDLGTTAKAMLLRCFTNGLGVTVPPAELSCPRPEEGLQTPPELGVSVKILPGGGNQPEIDIVVHEDRPADTLHQGVRTALLVRKSLEEALSSNHKNRLFETTGGNLGMGPRGCAEGDVVCFVDGYADLLLLRRCGLQYQYVGPCIVHGLPGDDLMERLEDAGDDVEIERFELI